MVEVLKWIGVAAVVFAAAVIVLRIAFPLPDPKARRMPAVSVEPQSTWLGRSLKPLIDAHPGLSGVYTLENGVDAFAARVLLARAASASIDAQYYIWHDDLTGIRLLAELQAAARRGVRVRLLVDDNGTRRLDQELAALDALPTAEVRIVNPFALRRIRSFNYVFDFFRVNRRMHNKSFTVDGIATIIGGRNIGDSYFESGEDFWFLDFDVLAVGPAATDVRTDFLRYWDSSSSYPVHGLIDLQTGSETLIDERDANLSDTPQGQRYSEAVQSSSLISKLDGLQLAFEWVPARVFSDDPDKLLGLSEDKDLMIRRLMAEIGEPSRSFDMVSAYFVPGAQATANMTRFATDGVRVRVLTNSLEATDVTLVHAGYLDYRDTLLRGGVELYEFRSETEDRRRVNELGITKFSKAALHAKSLSIDGHRAFVGSLNFDPRSKRLNTEMGLLVDSPALANRISGWLDTNLPMLAYKIGQDPAGRTIWTARAADGTETVYHTEPLTTRPLRIVIAIVGLLPIQWLL